MLTLYRLGQLWWLAIRLKRRGALVSLARMPFVPVGLLWLLKSTTWFVPVARNVPSGDGARLADALSKLGPAYIKLGQTLATRPDVIGPVLAESLATLQDRLPPFPAAEAKKAIEAELGGPVAQFFKDFGEEAIAAASIAQVHKATTKDGRVVAVKILRPAIERRFLRELSLFEWIAEGAEKQSAEARRLRLTDVVAKVRSTTRKELDLRLEAAAAAELQEQVRDEQGYRIPTIEWPLTSKRLLVLEWVEGRSLSDQKGLLEDGHDLTELARVIIHSFLRQALDHGHFHGDLHQGNLIVEKDGTVVAVDFGIMGRLSLTERRYLAEILYGFIKRDYRRVAEIHFDAGYVPGHHGVDDFAQALRAIADPIMDLPVHEISAGHLLAQLFATTQRFDMQTQPQLIVLQRTMVMAEGLAVHLDPNANMWELSRPVLETWIRNHFSPKAKFEALARDLPRLAARLPYLIEKLTKEETPAPQVQMYRPPHPSFGSLIIAGFIGAGLALALARLFL